VCPRRHGRLLLLLPLLLMPLEFASQQSLRLAAALRRREPQATCSGARWAGHLQ
jgi:hypothetical protein